MCSSVSFAYCGERKMSISGATWAVFKVATDVWIAVMVDVCVENRGIKVKKRSIPRERRVFRIWRV